MHDTAVLIERYGLVVVFLNVLLSQAGLPLPIYPTIIVAAALATNSAVQIPEIVLAAVIASLIADVSWYWASRRYGRGILKVLCRLSLSPDSCVRRTETTFSKVGPASLLFSRFIPGLGMVSIALCGITEVSPLAFVALDGLGATIYATSAVLLGYVFRNAIFTALETLGELGGMGVALVASALAIWLATRWWQRQVFIRQLRMDKITAKELAKMIDGGDAPVILDVRSPAVRLRDGIIPGAVFAHPDEATATLASFPRDVEIVVYCSCPNEVSAALAAQHLKRAGFTKIRPLLGGLDAWEALGRPVGHEPKPCMSCEAQPVITAEGLRTAVWGDLIS
ncbi:MAG: DedA family protein/thiosulfate sulfurtransferase GlpE [Rhizomicrobium sp.]|jgi:membrane protein DedA with SNARE-associated domain/rhodanese-related sulfurtransferase